MILGSVLLLLSVITDASHNWGYNLQNRNVFPGTVYVHTVPVPIVQGQTPQLIPFHVNVQTLVEAHNIVTDQNSSFQQKNNDLLQQNNALKQEIFKLRYLYSEIILLNLKLFEQKELALREKEAALQDKFKVLQKVNEIEKELIAVRAILLDQECKKLW